MSKNSFKGFKGATFGDNTNIGGDNVKQIKIEEHSEIRTALNDISKDLKSIDNADSKDEAEIYYESLVKNIEKNDHSKVEKCLSKLQPLISNVSSLMTIASFFGLSIPGLTM
ncbi:hypothetical protein SAMN05421743_11446 [Thalassobacillus cyri]|uniref:Uncharacterized protein n=1 Tax=Thalassobacillus cyri TaxID=571932 RepID=A0A1H4G696_9BACI|nr:hypothetical protein [Thalassobacillus cyri]SEB05125.1 hypothetical protein SAMN05421743_11446 [Thalassobacillus cyri]